MLRAKGVVYIRGRYILAELGDAKHDPFRKLVLQLLEARSVATPAWPSKRVASVAIRTLSPSA